MPRAESAVHPVHPHCRPWQHLLHLPAAAPTLHTCLVHLHHHPRTHDALAYMGWHAHTRTLLGVVLQWQNWAPPGPRLASTQPAAQDTAKHAQQQVPQPASSTIISRCHPRCSPHGGRCTGVCQGCCTTPQSNSQHHHRRHRPTRPLACLLHRMARAAGCGRQCCAVQRSAELGAWVRAKPAGEPPTTCPS